MKLVGELVLASHNLNKLAEIRSLLAPYDIEILSAADLGISEIAETGSTLLENAILKAKQVAEITGKPTLADDSGFIVKALEDFPGVYSARYALSFPSLKDCYMDLNEKLSFTSDHSASVECVLCIYWPNGQHEEFIGHIDGQYVYPPRGTSGFHFDFVFQPQGYDKTFAELGPDVKNKISHRAQALTKFIDSCLKAV